MHDVDISEAMLCFSDRSDDEKNPAGKALIVLHPDKLGVSDAYSFTSCACFSNWRNMDEHKQLLQLLIEAWHAAAFHSVPAKILHEAMLVIPQYRNMLADDCLPERFRFERECEV